MFVIFTLNITLVKTIFKKNVKCSTLFLILLLALLCNISYGQKVFKELKKLEGLWIAVICR